ncbi:hypothetical protein GGH99_000552 [Coemansia sp. RSA 1285]|nr:hypothetical protein GGH99_000552 [Coemansia sp. RSA 1285]
MFTSKTPAHAADVASHRYTSLRPPKKAKMVMQANADKTGQEDEALGIEMKIAADQELKEIVTHHTERDVSDILKPVLPEDEIERGALEGAMAYVADRFAEMAKTAPQAKAASKFKNYKALRMLIGSYKGKSPRRIAAAKKFDFKPRDSLDLTRINIAISGSSKSPKQLSFADMLLVVEAKRKASDYNEALAQLIHYTGLLYAKQYNRRFFWGMTMCATAVRLYIFGHDKIYESPSIDICAGLVRLLVSWAFCPVSILGFDKTIEYLPEYNCLRIQTESLDGGKPHFFYVQNMHRTPENVFGRHTTCFLASEKPPHICLPSATSDTESTKARDAKATKERNTIKDWVEGVQTAVHVQKISTDSILEAARTGVTEAVTKIARARLPVSDKSSDLAAVQACISKIVEAIVDFSANPGEDYSAERVGSLAAEVEQVFDAAAARILAVGATIVADVIDYETADIFGSPLELAMCLIAAAKAELVQSIDSERFESNRFVKDDWFYSEWFQDDETIQGKLPLIVAGGAVCYKTRWCSDDSAPISDDTGTAFPTVNRDVLQKSKFRQHKRIVLDMVACRLNDVESVDELIVVVADAMHANHRILSECGILHRDISPHNILFTRDQDRNPTGMLIDFDCAVRVADEVAEGPNQTGTGPYMSIANLRQLKFPRTELDDWERMGKRVDRDV